MEVLFFSGLALILIGGLWVIARAFATHYLWGMACLFPFVNFLFVLCHWRVARLPFGVQMVGVGLLVLVSELGGLQ